VENLCEICNKNNCICNTNALYLRKNKFDMETTVRKQQASFRLNEDLLKALKIEAKRANRSLNNYVECLLMNVVSEIQNKETLEAIEEVRSGKYLQNKPVDMTNPDSMLKSILDE
jgi:hypothetical protein